MKVLAVGFPHNDPCRQATDTVSQASRTRLETPRPVALRIAFDIEQIEIAATGHDGTDTPAPTKAFLPKPTAIGFPTRNALICGGGSLNATPLAIRDRPHGLSTRAPGSWARSLFGVDA